MSQETMTLNQHAEQEYAKRHTQAREYAKSFVVMEKTPVQDMLPDMPLTRYDKPKFTFHDSKEFYQSKYPGCIILSSDEYEWDIAYRACRDGLIGGVYYGSEDIGDINRLAVELVQNNIIAITQSRKVGTDLIYIQALMPDELQNEISTWHAIGAGRRLSGDLIELGKQVRHDELENEDDPLASLGLEDMEPFAARIVTDIVSAIDVLTKEIEYAPEDIDVLLSDAAEKAGVEIGPLPVAHKDNIREYAWGVINPEEEDDYEANEW